MLEVWILIGLAAAAASIRPIQAFNKAYRARIRRRVANWLLALARTIEVDTGQPEPGILVARPVTPKALPKPKIPKYDPEVSTSGPTPIVYRALNTQSYTVGFSEGKIIIGEIYDDLPPEVVETLLHAGYLEWVNPFEVDQMIRQGRFHPARRLRTRHGAQ